jgi:hypothetical protein
LRVFLSSACLEGLHVSTAAAYGAVRSVCASEGCAAAAPPVYAGADIGVYRYRAGARGGVPRHRDTHRTLCHVPLLRMCAEVCKVSANKGVLTRDLLASLPPLRVLYR